MYLYWVEFCDNSGGWHKLGFSEIYDENAAVTEVKRLYAQSSIKTSYRVCRSPVEVMYTLLSAK